jgi:hypothetical protein
MGNLGLSLAFESCQLLFSQQNQACGESNKAGGKKPQKITTCQGFNPYLRGMYLKNYPKSTTPQWADGRRRINFHTYANLI